MSENPVLEKVKEVIEFPMIWCRHCEELVALGEIQFRFTFSEIVYRSGVIGNLGCVETDVDNYGDSEETDRDIRCTKCNRRGFDYDVIPEYWDGDSVSIDLSRLTADGERFILSPEEINAYRESARHDHFMLRNMSDERFWLMAGYFDIIKSRLTGGKIPESKKVKQEAEQAGRQPLF